MLDTLKSSVFSHTVAQVVHCRVTDYAWAPNGRHAHLGGGLLSWGLGHGDFFPCLSLAPSWHSYPFLQGSQTRPSQASSLFPSSPNTSVNGGKGRNSGTVNSERRQTHLAQVPWLPSLLTPFSLGGPFPISHEPRLLTGRSPSSKVGPLFIAILPLQAAKQSPRSIRSPQTCKPQGGSLPLTATHSH